MHDCSPSLQLALQIACRNIVTDGEVLEINRKCPKLEIFLESLGHSPALLSLARSAGTASVLAVSARFVGLWGWVVGFTLGFSGCFFVQCQLW